MANFRNNNDIEKLYIKIASTLKQYNGYTSRYPKNENNAAQSIMNSHDVQASYKVLFKDCPTSNPMANYNYAKQMAKIIDELRTFNFKKLLPYFRQALMVPVKLTNVTINITTDNGVETISISNKNMQKELPDFLKRNEKELSEGYHTVYFEFYSNEISGVRGETFDKMSDVHSYIKNVLYKHNGFEKSYNKAIEALKQRHSDNNDITKLSKIKIK